MGGLFEGFSCYFSLIHCILSKKAASCGYSDIPQKNLLYIRWLHNPCGNNAMLAASDSMNHNISKLREVPKSPLVPSHDGNIMCGRQKKPEGNNLKDWVIRSQAPNPDNDKGIWRRFRDYMEMGLRGLVNLNEGLRYSPAPWETMEIVPGVQQLNDHFQQQLRVSKIIMKLHIETSKSIIFIIKSNIDLCFVGV
jgi:hypothetical protein